LRRGDFQTCRSWKMSNFFRRLGPVRSPSCIATNELWRVHGVTDSRTDTPHICPMDQLRCFISSVSLCPRLPSIYQRTAAARRQQRFSQLEQGANLTDARCTCAPITLPDPIDS
jgi:hypothetical protein